MRFPTAAAWVAAAALLFGLPSIASARTESLGWTHPDPAAVTGFKVHWGTSPGSYSTTIDISNPGADASGVYRYDLTVPDTLDVWIAVTAYNSSVESPPSNERLRQAPATPTPTPSPTPTPDPDPTPTPDPDPTPTPPPPAPAPDDPNALWSNDFESASLGTQVPGWTDTQSDDGVGTDNSLFGVVSLGGDQTLGTAKIAEGIQSHVTSTGSSSWRDYEFRGVMAMTDATARIGVTAYSQFPDAPVAYRLEMHRFSGVFVIHGIPWDGSAQSCTKKDTGVVASSATWYRFRFQVESQSGQNVLRAKVWENGQAEPADWQATCTDTSPNRPTSGTVGVRSGGGPGDKYWDDLEVVPLSGSGDSTPPPAQETLGAPGRPFIVD